jgi:hypothetical protein
MGKLLIFAGVIIAVVIILGLWGYLLQNRSEAKKMGLKGSKKRMELLELQKEEYATVLREIREIAESSEVTSGDPLWSFVRDKADAALAEKGIEK